MCYLSNSMNLSPRVRDYSRNLLCSMYNCNKCTTATVNVRVWHMTVPPAFFASRADTNPCNHRMNCSPLRNLHRHHVEMCLPPRCTDSQKSCGLLDKKGSNFWIIQPWRNQNLAFLSLSPQHPDWIPSHPFSRLLTPPGHHPFSRSSCPIITIVRLFPSSHLRLYIVCGVGHQTFKAILGQFPLFASMASA